MSPPRFDPGEPPVIEGPCFMCLGLDTNGPDGCVCPEACRACGAAPGEPCVETIGEEKGQPIPAVPGSDLPDSHTVRFTSTQRATIRERALAIEHRNEADMRAADAEYQAYLESEYTDPALARKLDGLPNPGRGGATDYERGFGEGWHACLAEVRNIIARHEPLPAEAPTREVSDTEADFAFDAARERARRN